MAKRHASGYTLIEVLVALAVTGVAVQIFISLLTSSIAVGDTSRNNAVASSLAEEQLEVLLREPQQFNWPLGGVEAGNLAEVTPRDDSSAYHRFGPPSSLPAVPRAHGREINFYDKFWWKAYARLPEANTQYVEVTVVVHWAERGRPRLTCLTTAMPRSAISVAPKAESAA